MHLSDSFLELFTFIRYVTDSSELVDADYATVRGDVSRLVGRLEKRANEYGCSPEQFEMARFAAFAWADEAVLCSTWGGVREWLKNPLQREYYGTANAGEEFYERLDGLLGGKKIKSDEGILGELGQEAESKPVVKAEDAEVLEVYTLCLALGYTGKYFSETDRGSLDRLRQDCISRIVDKQGSAGLSAFPEAYGSGKNATLQSVYRRVFDPLSIVFTVLPVLVVGGIFFAYRGLLFYSLNLWFE
ncbi:MAG: DotU family type IV/VI secretion system protein [Pseudodesulfovibrio sp.]